MKPSFLLVAATLASMTSVLTGQAADAKGTNGANSATQQEPELTGKEGFPYLTQRYLNEVGIDQRVGDQLPLDLVFTDQKGRNRPLTDFFAGDGRPVILTFNYASCPTLCQTQLDQFCQTLTDMSAWQAGQRFRIVTVSIDPKETAERALQVHDRLAGSAGIDPTATGTLVEPWTYLTSNNEAAIRKLAEAAGFHYSYDPKTGQYQHATALILCTAEGKVARYLFKIPLPAQTLRLALADTADGELRTTSDRVLLFCFQFDPEANSYALAAWNMTRVFLSIFLLVFGGFLLRMFRKERKLRTQLNA